MAIFIITAPSGSGKTSLAQIIQMRNIWDECISNTTRPMRDGELEGKTYYFTDIHKFKEMRDNNEFAEQVNYGGNLYGITHKEIERVMSKGRHVYIIAEYNGYKQIKELYPNAIGIFLYMSKEDCMANMLLRGDSLTNALNRISTYDDEMKNRDKYDYVIKNVRNRKDFTVKALEGIIEQYSPNLKSSL